ncbi:MAG TPA: YbhN family protein [Actinomycetota bacterium]|nr:YbhN family protein [Actinomycetota bacterium]
MSPVSSDQTGARSAAQRRRRWVGHAVRWIIGIGAAVVAFNGLFGRRDELSGALSTLEHVHYGWVVFAVIAELASIGAYAALTRQLLRAGGIDISLGGLTGITLAANAIQNSLPAGPAWSTLYAYRQFRRRGADPVLVGWTLAISVLISIATLGAIALVGLVLSEDQAASLDLVRVIVAVALVILGLVTAARRGLVTLPGRSAAVRVVRAVQRMVRRPRGDATDLVNRAFERLRVVNLTKRSLATAAAWAMANWWLDLTALALSFVAVGSKVPWRGLLLAYGAGQLAANLPVTLGGLGVVEGSLTVALVFYGGAQEATVAAVLLYRIISFWMMLLVGWTAALVIKIRTPKLEEARAR